MKMMMMTSSNSQYPIADYQIESLEQAEIYSRKERKRNLIMNSCFYFPLNSNHHQFSSWVQMSLDRLNEVSCTIEINANRQVSFVISWGTVKVQWALQPTYIEIESNFKVWPLMHCSTFDVLFFRHKSTSTWNSWNLNRKTRVILE